MNIKTVKKLVVSASLCAMFFSGSVFSQGNSVMAEVPFVVNVDASVWMSLGGGMPNGKNVKANVCETFVINLAYSSVRYGGVARQANAAQVSYDARGNINLRLTEENYRSAEVTLHSVNGRRVMHKKIDGVTMSVAAHSNSMLRLARECSHLKKRRSLQPMSA